MCKVWCVSDSLFGSAAELPGRGVECCFDSLTPPAGAYTLSGGDPGSGRTFGVWRAWCRLCQPATEKTQEGIAVSKFRLVVFMKNIMRWRVTTCTVCVLTEEAALCAPLPCPECDIRGDNEHVRSRRQVQNINTLCPILYPKCPFLFSLISHFQHLSLCVNHTIIPFPETIS